MGSIRLLPESTKAVTRTLSPSFDKVASQRLSPWHSSFRNRRKSSQAIIPIPRIPGTLSSNPRMPGSSRIRNSMTPPIPKEYRARRSSSFRNILSPLTGNVMPSIPAVPAVNAGRSLQNTGPFPRKGRRKHAAPTAAPRASLPKEAMRSVLLSTRSSRYRFIMKLSRNRLSTYSS